MARAISSLPVPFSPWTWTLASVPAAFSTVARTARIAGECGTSPVFLVEESVASTRIEL
jgi:hypothetical protein